MNNRKTQAEVANMLGVTITQYWRYERGACDMPCRRLIAFCSLFNVSADYVLGLNASDAEKRPEEPIAAAEGAAELAQLAADERRRRTNLAAHG